MRLNPDCVRDILIYLEDNLAFDENCKLSHLNIKDMKDAKQLSKYDKEDIFYNTLKLIEVKFISGDFLIKKDQFFTTSSYINDITWEGHEFLNSVRPQSVWDATKVTMSKIGITSLSMLAYIAKETTKKIISDPSIIIDVFKNINS